MQNIVDQSAIDAEAAKPDYANFRGLIARDGTPLDKHYARMNLLRSTPEAHRAEAYRDHYEHRMADAYKPQVNADGRPLATLTDTERARDAMIAEMANAWRN